MGEFSKPKNYKILIEAEESQRLNQQEIYKHSVTVLQRCKRKRIGKVNTGPGQGIRNHIMIIKLTNQMQSFGDLAGKLGTGR